MTGETGAGKSILVGALGLLMGRRATADLVRAGAEEAQVTALFNLEDPGLCRSHLEAAGVETGGEEILLRRVVTSTGRSRCYVNGQPVTQHQLAELGEALLSISGQHDQQSLLKPASQLDFLDRFGGHEELLAAMRKAWRDLGQAGEALKALEDKLKEAEEKRDLYEFQRDEIAKVAPALGEDDDLLDEKNRAKNSEKLLEALSTASELLGGEPGNAVEKLGRVKRNLERVAEIDSRFEEKVAVITDCYHQLADLSVSLEVMGREVDADPERLEWVDERLNTLAKLKRKYNLSLADIIGHGRHLTEILDQLDGAGLELAELRRKKAAAAQKAFDAAKLLHQAREKNGKKLAAGLTDSLRPLGFPKIEMRVEVEAPADGEAESRLSASGYDRIAFLFSPNPGEGMKPLAKIASGGELSRVMLALKTVREHPSDQLLVFDEIDTGLGGATAEAVAAKIAGLSTRQQVVVITHLPQMAALPGQHFVVAKEADETLGRTVTSITPLSAKERAGELARMLGGAAPSREAQALARQMLAR